MNSEKDFGIEKEKYSKTKLSEEKGLSYLSTIKRFLIDEKLYLTPSLTLTVLSEKTEIPSKYISQLINQELGKSFSDYLQELRIEDVKKKLIDPGYHHLSIAGIASESGFASSSRFNNQFKKIVGMTPSEYQKINTQ